MTKPSFDKVYLVTTGSYSSYQVRAVTLTKERAEMLQRLFSKNDDSAYIEERLLDEVKPDQRNLYAVAFVKDQKPTVVWFNPNPPYEYLHKQPIPDVLGPLDYYSLSWKIGIQFHVLASDEDCAIKIAQDAYAKHKAEKEGIV